MILVQIRWFLALTVASIVYGDHSVLVLEILDLMPPDEPELWEAVAEQHDRLPSVLLPIHTRLHVVKPHAVHLDISMDVIDKVVVKV